MLSKLQNKIFNWLAKKLFPRLQWMYYRTPYIHGPAERLTIGKNTKLANSILNTRSGRIEIGDNVICGHNVSFLTGVHNYQNKSPNRDTLEDENRDIVVKQGAWISSEVTVIGPVIIGENSVVAAGSVVLNDIPDDVIVAGVPAKVIRNIDYSDGNLE
jgi:acetyltransferase-like isoleucine patch superfamily enzyme